MPPLKKGAAYCFATVGRSVCRSVDQVLSTQYLLTPSLDQYQTWCRGCPQWVDDTYWFSGHMFKVQGQITLPSPLCCPLNIFWPFTWSIPNLMQGLPSMSWWSLLIFRSHVQRSRSNHYFEPSVLSAQYLLTPSLDQYQTWCMGCPQWVDDPYWFSGHMFKGQGQTTILSPVCCPLEYILIPCLLSLDRFCFYWICTMGSYMFLKHFLFMHGLINFDLL